MCDQDSICSAANRTYDEIGIRVEACSFVVTGEVNCDQIEARIAAGEPFHLEDAFMAAWPWVHCEHLDGTYRAVWWHSSLAAACTGTPYEYRALINRYGAERHARVIHRFGRYPARNVILSRESTAAELRHLRSEADLWERQQTKLNGTWLYRIKAVGFFVRTAIYLVGCRDAGVLLRFLRSILFGASSRRAST